MSIYRLFCIAVLNCFVLEAALATNSVVISRVHFLPGDIESFANQLQAILSEQVSTNYVVTLNCDLPEIVIPNSVTNVVDSTLYNNTLSSFRNEITAKYEGDITEPTFRYVTLRCALDFIDEAFKCKTVIIDNEIAIRLFPPRLQFDLYSLREAKLIPFVSASPFERLKITFIGEGYLVLAPPELHREFRRIVYRLEHGEDSGPATTNGTERIRAQNLIRPYVCDLGFTNCYFAIGNDFHVVATNTLAMMERIVAAQCLIAEAVGVLSSDYSGDRLQIGVEYLPGRDAFRRDIRSVFLCDDDEVADRIGMLRDTMLSYEKQARYMVGDGHILKPKVHQEACQNDVIQTNGLMNCNLDGGLVDLGGNSLWNFDSWDALGTTVVDSQIAYSTRDDLREIPTAEFANPNLNLIFVFLRSRYMAIMYDEFCAALLIRLERHKGGEERITSGK